MAEMRYNRVFKQGIAAIVFCILMSAILIGTFIIFKIQYDQLVSDMVTIEATITDIDYRVHRRGPDEQEIYIEYVLDGIVYNRELSTDTGVSYSAGTGADFSIGDKVTIFYDPQDPNVIASPRSVSVGYFWLIFGLCFLLFVLWLLWWMLKKRHSFLVTKEEYDKEVEDIKKRKQLKKQEKAERKKKKR